MKLGVDLDGVLANWNDPMLALLNKVYFTHHKWGPEGGPTTWNWPVDQFGFTKDEVHKVWLDHINNTDFWETLPVLDQPGLDHIKRLQYLHDIYFLTNRTGPQVKARTENWLLRHGVMVPTVLQVRGSKAKVIDGLALDCFIDDSADNLSMGTNPYYTPYLRDAPYNGEGYADIRRVRTITGMLMREGVV